MRSTINLLDRSIQKEILTAQQQIKVGLLAHQQGNIAKLKISLSKIKQNIESIDRIFKDIMTKDKVE